MTFPFTYEYLPDYLMRKIKEKEGNDLQTQERERSLIPDGTHYLSYNVPGFSDTYLMEINEIQTQINLIDTLLKGDSYKSCFVNDKISFFSKSVVSFWAKENSCQFIEVSNLFINIESWLHEFEKYKPEVLFLSEAEFNYLTHTQLVKLSEVGHIFIVNPQYESYRSKDILSSERSFDITYLIEIDCLPGFSFTNTIAKEDIRESTGYTLVRTDRCKVLKNGSEVSGLTKGYLNFQLIKEENGQLIYELFETPITARQRREKTQLFLDLIMSINGQYYSKNSFLISFQQEYRCKKVELCKEPCGLFPFTLRYAHYEEIATDFDHPIFGSKVGLRRCAHLRSTSVKYKYADDTTISLLSASPRLDHKVLFQRLVDYNYETFEIPISESSSLASEIQWHEKDEVEAITTGVPLELPVGSSTVLTEQLVIAARTNNGVSLIDSLDHEVYISYAEIYKAARDLALKIRAIDLVEPSPIIIQLNDLKSYLLVYWAVLLAGHIVVPQPNPKTFDNGSDAAKRLKNILRLLPNAIIITEEYHVQDNQSIINELEGNSSQVYSFNDIQSLLATDKDLPQVTPEQIAIYLFTSGSTGLPKCIQQTHDSLCQRNLAANQHCKFDSKDVFLNWMPLDHVGGIQMMVNSAVSACANLILCKPEFILADVTRWLSIIQGYKVTFTWAPNFAFAQLLEEKERILQTGYDLSSLRHWLTGGESVSAQINQQLYELLKPFGLDNNCIRPAYGMSETCSGITHALDFDAVNIGLNHIVKSSLNGKLKYRTDPGSDTVSLVEVGPPLPGVNIRIVDKENSLMSENQIGRLQVSGPIITQGYLNNYEANENLLKDGWFNTGDLAFIKEGKLTITGREKDLIILNGLNYQNYEIEGYIEEIPEIGANAAIAASKYDAELGKELLHIFLQTKFINYESLCRKVNSKLTKSIGVKPDIIVFLDEKDFLVTESGKKRRSVVLDRFTNAEFSAIYNSTQEQHQFNSDHIFTYALREAGEVMYSPTNEIPHLLISERNHNLLDYSGFLLSTMPEAEGAIQSIDESPFIVSYDITFKKGNSINWAEEVAFIKEITRFENLIQLNIITPSIDDLDFAIRYGYLPGLLASIQEEQPKLCCRQVAIPHSTDKKDWIQAIINESLFPQKLPLVSTDGKSRRIPVLKRLKNNQQLRTEPNLRSGEYYLITGALGGVGAFICEKLMEEFDVKILAIGRTDFKGPISSHLLFDFETDLTDKKERLNRLSSNDFHYRSCDISSFEDLNSCIESFERSVGKKIVGYFHLAGNAQLNYHWQHMNDHLFQNESINVLDYMMKAKVSGTINLERCFSGRSGFRRFVFGSVNAYFGGNSFSSYSAVSSFLNFYAEEQAANENDYSVFHWSQWRNLGMSKGDQNETLSLRRGYYTIEPTEGWKSFKKLIQLPAGNYYVGLDQSNPFIQLESEYSGFNEVGSIYHDDGISENEIRRYIKIAGGGLRDWQVYTLPADQFSNLGAHSNSAAPTEKEEEDKTEIETKLSEIWSALLKIDDVRRSDNFFELGGHSILATKLLARIAEQFNTEISFSQLFQSETLADLGQMISRNEEESFKLDILPTKKSEKYPLSPAQSRIWMVHKLEGGGDAYLVPGLLHLDQELDIDSFKWAIDELVKRHEILRTVFVEEMGVPYQSVKEDFYITDFLTIYKKDLNVQTTIQNLIQKGLDLEGGFLFHCHLFPREKNKFTLLVLLHHINADGVSLAILTKDLQQLYGIKSSGRKSTLAPLRIQHKDFSQWYESYLTSPKGKKEKTFWLNHLKGFSEKLKLPIDFDRQKEKKFIGASERLQLDITLTEQIQRFAADKRMSLFNVLLTVSKVLMYRLSGQEDLLLGTSIDLRITKDLEDQIGQYVNVLPLRTKVSASDTFLSLSQRSNDTLQRAMEHKLFPYEKLIADQGIQRELNNDGLVNVLLVMHNFDSARSYDQYLKFRVESLENNTSKFDLVFAFSVSDGQLNIDLRYSKQLFSAASIKSILNSYRALIAESIKDEHKRIQTFRLDQPFTKERLLQAFEDAAFNDIIELVLEKAKKSPESIALRYEDESYTYKELIQLASSVAYQLDQYKAKRIGVFLQAGSNFIPQLLGIWMAGKSYIPVNLDLPKDQILAIISQTNMSLAYVLDKNDRFVNDLKSSLGRHITILNSNLTLSERPFKAKLNKNEEAYVYFTSGTTGKPKGIIGSRKSLSHFIDWEIHALGIHEEGGIVVAQLTSPGFDASLRDVFLALCTGNIIDLPGYQTRNDLHLTRKWIKTRKVNVLHIVPSLLRAIVATNSEDKATMSSLQHVLLAGEPLYQKDIKLFQSNFGKEINFYNLYGATESTLIKSFWKCDDTWGLERLPVGKGINDTDLVLLNELQELCGYGEMGEVYIRSPYLSLGYLNEDDNVQSFVQNPFHSEYNDLFYRTGDFGRYDSSNNLVLYGRRDEQIKINGVRVELNAITSTAMQYPGITQAAVKVFDCQGRKYLVLFIEEGSVDSLELHTFLKSKLPISHLPNHIEVLHQIPLNSNGKIDFHKLSLPKEIEEFDGDQNNDHFSFDSRLLSVWSEVLNREPEEVDPYKSFFEQGGNSLLVMVLIAKVQQAFKTKLSINGFFKEPSLQYLSEQIGIEQSKTSSPAPILPIQAGNDEIFPVAQSQKRLWLLNELEGGNNTYNVKRVFHLEGCFEHDCFSKALSYLIARHEILRTSFTFKNEGIYQKIYRNPQIHDLLTFMNLEGEGDPIAKAKEIISKDIEEPFDLAFWPLMRIKVISIGGDNHIVSLVKHHIISDGWSMEVFANELVELYNQGIHSKPLFLEQLPFQFKAFAKWQNERFNDGLYAENEKYWLKRFSNIPEPLVLPYDKPRFKQKTFNGALLQHQIHSETFIKLRAFADQHNVSVFMLTLTAFNLLFYRYTGETDITIGTPSAGRYQAGLQNQIGFYVNTLALRTVFEEQDSFLNLLKRVKETTVEALEHEEYPFDKLVGALDLEMRMDHSPLFDVVVQFMNTGTKVDRKTQFEGLKAYPFETDWKTSQYDQNFSFTETEDGLSIAVEYNTDLFFESSIRRQLQHLENILIRVIAQPDVGIHQLNFLTNAEKTAHDQLRKTSATYPETDIYHLFCNAVGSSHSKIAIKTSSSTISYGGLLDKVQSLSSFLFDRLGDQRTRIGLLMHEGEEAIASMLSSLCNGYCYVPIATSLPYNRIKYFVEDAEIELLIFSKAFLREAGQLYWECSSLKQLVCIDSDQINLEVEQARDIMSEELWDFIGQSSVDEISGGAWFSSYTGNSFSEAEMEEYAQNALLKLEPYLNKDVKVLEIGCASGLTMSKIAPNVHSYLGTDLSKEILSIAEDNLIRKGIENFRLLHASADEVAEHISGSYDLLIINSVIQCFSGYNYLKNVILSLIPYMNDDAILFFGDIQDLDLKDDFISDLRNYAKLNPNDNVKLDWSQELFIPKAFFYDLKDSLPFDCTVQVSQKIGKIENELTKFRYDVLAIINKQEIKNPLQSYLFDCSDFPKSIKEWRRPVSAGIDIPAYIIYTSGSTGKPKGCVISQRNVIRLLFNDQNLFDFNSEDTWIQSHGYHFDFSVWEIYGALLNASTLIVPNGEEVRDISTYYDIIRKNRVTVLNQTPQVFYQLSSFILNLDYPHNPSDHLRYVIFGGEKLVPGKLKKWVSQFPKVDMVNMYGITETTVHVTFHKIELKEIDQFPWQSNIGKPIPETQVYLEDKFGNAVPFNVGAEIKVGGSGVALEYYNRKKLTAQRFVTETSSPDRGRIYLSGDYAKLNQHADLVYLARKDHQVKIRGFRIETAEIEAALLAYPSIYEAVVIDIEDSNGDKSLMAYYTGIEIEQENLLAYISSQLPNYMIPRGIRYLDSIPKTKNGKLDRDRLPSGVDFTCDLGDTNRKDWTETQKIVADAFSEVLTVNQVGLDHNFFEIGGHSLKAMSLMSLLHSRRKVGVPLVYLYKFPTVRDIAHYIDVAKYMNIQYKEHPYIQLGNPSGKKKLILFPPALGSALAYGHLAELLPDTCLYSFNYVDSNDTMKNYVRLIQEIQPEGRLHIAGHSAGGFMAFHVAKEMEKAGREVAGVTILDAFRQHKEGKQHTIETISEGVDLYLKAKFEEFKDHFIDMEFFKEVCYKQVKQYYDFLFYAEQEGGNFIKAPIYFLKAENNYHRIENWSECTDAGVTEFYASGIHGKMVDEPYVQKNAVILNKILET